MDELINQYISSLGEILKLFNAPENWPIVDYREYSYFTVHDGIQVELPETDVYIRCHYPLYYKDCLLINNGRLYYLLDCEKESI